MKKRLIAGVIVIFLALAGQDFFMDKSTGGFGVPPKPPVPQASTTITAITSPTVIRIVDGDTIVVLINGISEKVRLIGVDTPETVDPRKTVQCFGIEASAFTKLLLLDKVVQLESDASQGDRDKYGRLLRYIFLENGTLVNEKIIADGYGHEYTYRLPYKYQTEFKNAEQIARKSQKGLWGEGVCGY